jgi:hypothetical protein
LKETDETNKLIQRERMIEVKKYNKWQKMRKKRDYGREDRTKENRRNKTKENNSSFLTCSKQATQ